MSVDWGAIGITKFETIVEALLARKWRDLGEFIAPDGRGGDDGIDIEVRQGNRRRIYQLKYFPDGFSGDRKSTRQRQIRKSFRRAAKLEPPPVEWTLVIPAKLTPGERTFVTALAQDPQLTGPAPKIEIIDRVVLDQLMMDYPDVYRYLVRAEMRSDVELYRLETETLTGGAALEQRVRDLGELADSTDLYWGTDFARIGDTVTRTLRAKDPRAHEKNPITITVGGMFGAEHAELRRQLDKSLRYGASGPVVLPAEVVRTVTVTGPELVAGEFADVEVSFEPLSKDPKLGTLAELRFIDEHGVQVISHEGRVSYLNRGWDGFAIRIEFYQHLHIEFLYPNDQTQPGHAEISYNFRQIRPADALGLEEILTAINETDLVCKVYLDGKFAVSLGFQARAEDIIDDGVEYVFSLAHDLKIVQEYCRSAFAIPDQMTTLERINLRVARLLLEGYVVASPKAPYAFLTLTGTDSQHLREILNGEGTFIKFTAQAVTFSLGAKELTLKDVLVFHPHATVINGAEAVEMLDSGRAEDFRLELRPGDDPFFYLAMPSRMGEPTPPSTEWLEALWGLPGITQPGENSHSPQVDDDSLHADDGSPDPL